MTGAFQAVDSIWLLSRAATQADGRAYAPRDLGSSRCRETQVVTMKSLTDVRRYRWWLLPMAALMAMGAAAAVRPQRAAPDVDIEWHTSHTALTAAGPDTVLRLQSLLGHHSLLACDMMRGRIRVEEDFLAAVNAALGKNTDAVSQLVGSLYGDEAARQFSGVWTKHLVALLSYARGLANDDEGTRAEARASLEAFERDMAGFFADASQGRLTRGAAETAVLMHVDHLLRQADAFASGDFVGADRIYREGYRHAYGLGLGVGRALLPPDQVAALDAPAWRLRSELNRLLAEHVELVVDGSQAGVLDRADFEAAGEAVNANTRELAAAVSSLFGTPAASTFQSIWADHIDQIMAYVAAVVSQDTKAKDEARARLGGVERRLAAFLSGATNRRLDSAGLAKMLVMHDQMLLAHADAFAARDYMKAHNIADAAFAHMYDLSGQLADAFSATVTSRAPLGGSATGAGGMADVVGRR